MCTSPLGVRRHRHPTPNGSPRHGGQHGAPTGADAAAAIPQLGCGRTCTSERGLLPIYAPSHPPWGAAPRCLHQGGASLRRRSRGHIPVGVRPHLHTRSERGLLPIYASSFPPWGAALHCPHQGEASPSAEVPPTTNIRCQPRWGAASDSYLGHTSTIILHSEPLPRLALYGAPGPHTDSGGPQHRCVSALPCARDCPPLRHLHSLCDRSC
jgi:hypothetical protein